MTAPRTRVPCRCRWLLAAAVLASWPTRPLAQTLAFPEAEGFGRFAAGARTNLASASVYRVTNLNDSGAGSFRDAVSQSNRFVVFDVGGIVTLNSVAVVSSNVTIAGQTAPGGIAFYGDRLAFTSANNTISRYIAVRKGEAGTREDSVSLSRGSNMMFDHMSVTWGVDETFSMNPDSGYVIDAITIQNTVIAQGLDRLGHSAGGLMTLGEGSRFSIIRSLFADNVTRNPKVRGENEFINNVVYGYETAGYIMGDTVNMNSRANAIGNYFIEGPVDGSSPFASGTPQFEIYGDDNWVDGDRDGLLDGSRIGTYPGATVATTPFAFPTTATMTAQQAVAYVTANAGPTITRDAVDTRIMQEVVSYGTLGGVIQYDTDLFPGYATDPVYLNPRSRPVDTDNDGMPDFWERSRGLNAASNADWKTLTGGYTNLEGYLNELGGNETASGWTAASGTWATGTWSGIRPNLTTVAAVSGSVSVTSGQAMARRLTVGGTGAAAVQVAGGSLDVFDTLRIGGLASGTVAVAAGASLGAGEVVLGGTGATAGDGLLTVTGGTLQTSFVRAATPGSRLGLTNATLVCTATPQIAVPTVTASNVTVVTPAGTGTWSGNISGSGTLIKQGPGTLVLSGSNSSTGHVRVDSGTVALNHVAAAGAGLLLLGGGNASFGSVSGIATPIVMTATTGTIAAGGITLNGSISGSAVARLAIATTTTGNLTLSGSLSGFGGTLDFGPSTGNIRLNGFGAAGSAATTFALGGSTAAIRTAFGATVQLGALSGGTGTRLQGATNNADAVAYVIGGKGLSTAFDGTVTDGVFTTPGVVSLTKTGTGTLTLTNAASTYTGVTRVSGGTLSVASLANGGTASGIGQSSADPANLVLDGGTLQYTGGAATIDRGLTLTGSGGMIERNGTGNLVLGGTAGIVMTGVGSRTLTLAGSSTSFNNLAAGIADPASGITSLVKSGSGTWRLAGSPKTYSGDTLVNGGALYLLAADVLPSGTGKGSVAVAAGATLDLYGNSHTINGLNGGGTVTTTINTIRTLTIGSGDASGTFAGVLTQGAGQTLALTKIGAGTQRLSGGSSYSGGTNLRGGALNVQSSQALGTGVVTISGSAKSLMVSSTTTLGNAIVIDGPTGVGGAGVIQHLLPGRGTLSGGTLTVRASPLNGAVLGVDSTGGELLVTSRIMTEGTARMSVSSGGSSRVTLAGGGSYSHLDQQFGTLRLGATNGIAPNALVTVGSVIGATFDLAGFDQSLAGISQGMGGVIGNSSTARDSTLTITGSSTYAGVLQDAVFGGTRRLNLAVDGGRLQLTAASAHSGTTSVRAGSLVLDGPTSLGTSRLALLSGGTASVGQAGSVAVTSVDFAGGVLDLGTGRVEIAAGGIDQGMLVAQLIAGRGDGTWNGGSGIVSTPIAAGAETTIGWIANGDGSLSVAVTAAGDATLDGVVDILDVAQFFGAGLYDTAQPALWADGDFNYDGIVDVLDMSDLFTSGAFGSAPPVASVPEPALPAGGVLAAVLLVVASLKSAVNRSSR